MDKFSIDSNRKRRFFSLCLAFGLPVIIGFAIVDYLEGDTVELVVDVAFLLVLVAGFFGITKFGSNLTVYRLGLGSFSVAFLADTLVGAGHGTVLYWLYIIPLVNFFFLGKNEGLLWSVIFEVLLGSLLLGLYPFQIYAYDLQISIRFLTSFTVVTIVAYGLESSRHYFSELLTREHERLVNEKIQLEDALKRIKTLSGLLPICSNCKKIRDDAGYWHQVEGYIEQYSEAEFSHGICPDCMQQLYAEFTDEAGPKS